MEIVGALVETARKIVGHANVLTGADTEGYASDWTGKYVAAPLCVARPADTGEVAALVRLASDTGTPVVPVGGNTGLTGGAHAPGAMLLSLERMNAIREIRPEARVAVVEAGVILERLHEAAADHGLAFPLTFGAKGSATIGGAMSTNAGGSNVLRHGNTRALVLGLEAVMPDGRVMNLMTALHKDNSGYDLRDLLIGAEGTLGIVTAAVVKLVPLPRAYVTAMVTVASLADALALLRRLQRETGGAVEAFEYMPDAYFEALASVRPDLRLPLAPAPVNVMLEVAISAPADAEPGPDGTAPALARLEETLAEEMAAGRVRDAALARSETQRREIWALREAAAEVTLAVTPNVGCDVALPLDAVPGFYGRVQQAVMAQDPEARALSVAHLGDGNIHYTVYPTRDDAALAAAIMETVEDVAIASGGSFSAEHGIGLSKKPAMVRHKDPVALAVMRQIKTALDPKGIMNPGKVLPDA